MPEKMPIPTRHRALTLAASYLEHELDDMREEIRRNEEQARELEERHPEADVAVRPLSTSHEADLMKAVEWATCAAVLRAMAEREPTAEMTVRR